MAARFLVKNVFRVTGRGAVAAGDILGGTIQIGMWTQPLDVDGERRPLQVTGVEIIDSISERRAEVGLLFDSVPEREMLEQALPADSILLIGGP